MTAAQTRKAALERLADEHGTSPADNTTAGEDLADLLEAPEKIKEWCAVTERDSISYLYADCDSAETAKTRALQYMGDPTFHEMPVEVVNLDTGEGFAVEIGVVSWHPTGNEKESAEARAVRLLKARCSKWRVELADTGGGVVVCAITDPDGDDESAPYVWVTGDEEDPAAFLVCLYTPEGEEALTSKTVAPAQLASYAFGEIERAVADTGKEG